MSTRSSLTVVSGTTITSAWGNGIRDHIVARTTSNDVSSEGQFAANTSTDRIIVHNGSGGVRFGHYSASGRTGVVASKAGIPVSAGGAAHIDFLTSSDPDGIYAGWNGLNYGFVVPSGLGGLWTITVSCSASTPISVGGISLDLFIGSVPYIGYSAPTTSAASVCTGLLPLAAADRFYVYLENKHSSSVNFDVRINAYRESA